MALTENPVNHLQLTGSTAALLKSSTSLELGYGVPSPSLKSPVQRRFSIEKTDIEVTVCSDEEVEYGIASAPIHSWAKDEIAHEDTHMQCMEDVVEISDEIKGVANNTSKIKITDLPEEVQEQILGYIVGDLGSISSKSSGLGVKNWNRALRHSRAKEATSLALVTPLWTKFIQQRLYRHSRLPNSVLYSSINMILVRIQGTQEGLNSCYTWFVMKPHFQNFVRHVDFWVPIWEIRPQHTITIHPRPLMSLEDFTHTEHMQPISSNYRLSSKSSTIEEMFQLITTVFPNAAVLTIEGGTCRKPPRIPLSRNGQMLPELPKIKTLVLKSAWTMIRDTNDYATFTAALPNLKDWQCMYSAPKFKAYAAINAIVPKISNHLTHLHICMDGFYSKKWLNPNKIEDLRVNHHLCTALGGLLLQLEALTFSGRACAMLFTSAMDLCTRKRGIKPQLRSVDLALRNCCRDRQSWSTDGIGVYNTNFIHAFERLVVSATASLKMFTRLTSMRIRFVDLDSPMAYLNPYFNLKDGFAYGLWSEAIAFNLINAPVPIMLAQEEAPSNNESNLPLFTARRTVGRRPNRMHVRDYMDMGYVL